MNKISIFLILGIFVFSIFSSNVISTNISPLTNPSNFDDFDMVIITTSEYKNIIQPLISHKNSLGINTLVNTTDEIYNEFDGRDNAEQIKYYIKDS